MNKRLIETHMSVAETYAQLSYAKRLKVGAIVVKDDRVISIGYNGTPSGWDNECEEIEFVLAAEVQVSDEEMYALGFTRTDKNNWQRSRTKKEVIHAEANAIAKLAKHGEKSDGAVMFCTHMPCIDCAKQIAQAGIKKVYYRNTYRDTFGGSFLTKFGVEIEQV